MSDATIADAVASELDDRQRDALGTIHDLLQRLEIAVVGAGGLGSPIAEQLVRMGAGSVTIVDHDLLDTPSNVRRVVGSTAADLRATTPPPKVDVVGRHLDQLGLGRPVRRLQGDIRHERTFRHLLDADIVISATDTHGSRAVLNDLASTYLMPVIDVGVQAGGRKNGDLAALVAEICVLTPVSPCLWCRGRISADVIRAENLPPEQRDRLVREGYLVGGVGQPALSVMALTALGAGLATCALLALLSSEGDVCPSGYWVDGLMGDAAETKPTEPLASCRCRSRIAAGDTQPPPFVPEYRSRSPRPVRGSTDRCVAACDRKVPPYGVLSALLPSGGMLDLLPNGGKGDHMTIRSIRDLAAAVRGRRKDLGMNQAELAERAGVSRKWIYEFEAGKPTAEFGLILRVLDALSLALELTPGSDAGLPGRDDTVDLDALIDEHRGQ